MNAGEKLLEINRLSRRHSYIENGELRIYRDPMFDEEKRLLMERISKENKRAIAKELGVSIRQLPKEKIARIK